MERIESVTVCAVKVPVLRKRLRSCYGYAEDEPTPIIVVKTSLRGALEANTIFHEALHQVDWMNGLQLKEEQVNALQHALSAFIRDNPELIAAIQQG